MMECGLTVLFVCLQLDLVAKMEALEMQFDHRRVEYSHEYKILSTSKWHGLCLGV